MALRGEVFPTPTLLTQKVDQGRLWGGSHGRRQNYVYNDFKKFDFDEMTILLELCKYITGFRVTEHIFLEKSKCPACGGNIEQTPYRIGCDKCDYFTHEEL